MSLALLVSSQRRLDSAAYVHFETRVRGTWHASARAGIDETEIARAAGCSPADAYRVAALRRLSAPPLVELWLRGALSVRQLGRIVLLDAPLLDPHTEEDQIEFARHHPSAARALRTAK